MSRRHTNSRGFTLLEILLVVGIIAILAGIVIVALNPSKQFSVVRNTQRKANLAELNKALYQYYIDNSHYPVTLTTTLTEICATGATTTPPAGGCGTLIDLSALVPTYLVAIPTDPQGSTLSLVPIAYATTNGTGYKVAVNAANKVTLSAPQAELGTTISIGNMSLICTSFTYSDWTTCTGSNQTRTILTSSPENCQGGEVEVLSQSCVAVLPSITYNGSPLYVHPMDNGANKIWGCYGTVVGASSPTDGAANTSLIVAGCATADIAARICSDLSYGGFNDWYLPAIDQLAAMYTQRNTVNKGDYTAQWVDFQSASYWSSTEYNYEYARLMGFNNNNNYTNYRSWSFYVRCVRS